MFHHVHSPLALSLESLWVHTTYTLITSFRSHAAQGDQRIVTRFRQFLLSEEAWYRQLVGRICKAFGLKALVEDGLALVDIRVKDEGEQDPQKVSLIYKALVCLGDIERYKAQYPRSDFDRARAYYDAARIVNPHDGAAFNQLAVIATYTGDDFSCIYYYFRSLQTKVPFKGANDILAKFLAKPGKQEGWRREVHRDVANVFSGRAADSTLALVDLLSRRTLSSESIVKLSAISIGAHYQCRMQGNETHALEWTLRIFESILTVAATEVETVLADTSAIAPDHISPTLRRLLPSLRIYSKWLKLHIDHLADAPFWATYYRFIESIARAFPLAQLPMCEGQLEEDRDMRGYLPISKGLAHGSYSGHPSAEQLMRLADIQVDATLILQSQTIDDASEDDPVNLAMRSSQDEIGIESQGSAPDERKRESVNLDSVRALWGPPDPVQSVRVARQPLGPSDGGGWTRFASPL